MKIVYQRVGAKAVFYGLIEYIFIIFVILSFRTPFALAVQRDYYLNEITAILSVILLISEISRTKIKYTLLTRWVFVFSIYYVVTLLYIFTGGIENGVLPFIAKFLILLPALSLTLALYFDEHKIIDLLKKYCNIMCIIAVISLFFWLFGSILHIIHPTGSFNAYWGTAYSYPSYFNLYFERQYDTVFDIRINRNMGMFLEGPMYSSCLVIAIAIKLFLTEDLRYYDDNDIKRRHSRSLKQLLYPKTLILIIALITTLTTTGYIMLIFMIILTALINKHKNRQIKKLKYISTAFAAVAAFYLAHMIFLNKSTSMSWETRMDDYAAGFTVWKKSFLWGVGFSNWDVIKSYMSLFRRDNLGFSNGIFVVLVEGGLLLLSVYIFPIITCIYNALKQNKLGLAAFTVVVIIEFVVAVIHYEFLMMLLLALFYAVTICSMGKRIQ